LKRDEKKDKQKVMVEPSMPIVVATAASSSNGRNWQELSTNGTSDETTPSSPSNQSHEEAGLENSVLI
jgi:hypothetical protein